MLLFLPGKEVRIFDDAVLDHLGQAGAVFPCVHAGQQEGVDQHRLWLMEGADQVFAGGGVHPGLATHRAVDHGQKAGGYLDEANAAHPASGDEAGQIAGDAATQGDDHAGTVDAVRGAGLPQDIGGLQVFDGFPGGKADQPRWAAGELKRMLQALAIVFGDHGIGDDQQRAIGDVIVQQFTGPVQAAGFDQDGVALAGQVDSEGGHQAVSGCRSRWRRAVSRAESRALVRGSCRSSRQRSRSRLSRPRRS